MSSLTAVLLLAGCTTAPERPAAITPATKLEAPYKASVVWMPNPSIDLMSPEGTFVRAVAESWRRAQASWMLGSDALKDGYPGFERAYNDSYGSSIMWVGRLRDVPPATQVGTDFFEVVNVERNGDVFTIDVCNYWSQIAYTIDDEKYQSYGSNFLSEAYYFIFGPEPGGRRLPPADQKGSANSPSGDVFGGWVLSEIGSRDPAQCNKLAPGTPPDWKSRSTPPPTLPPDPGWPAVGPE